MRQDPETGPTSPESTPSPHSKRIKSYFKDLLPTNPLVYLLLIHTWATSLLDAATYASFEIFHSVQTGNTLLLAVGALDVHLPLMVNAGVSIASFCTNCFIFGQIACRIKPHKGKTRWWAILTTFYQAIMLMICIILLYTDVVYVDDQDESKNRLGWLLILFLSCSAGAQITMARQFNIKEVPTAMLTNPFADLFSDPHLLTMKLKGKEVRSRNLRIAYITSLVVGVFSGAAIYRGTSVNIIIIIAFCVKMALVVMKFIIKGEKTLSN